jgi:hypothetical protein
VVNYHGIFRENNFLYTFFTYWLFLQTVHILTVSPDSSHIDFSPDGSHIYCFSRRFTCYLFLQTVHILTVSPDSSHFDSFSRQFA